MDLRILDWGSGLALTTFKSLSKNSGPPETPFPSPDPVAIIFSIHSNQMTR